MDSASKRKITSHLVEFFVVGLVMGVVEDLLAIHFATEVAISIHTIKVAFVVAFPFAVISELLIDADIFRRYFFKKRGKREKSGGR